MIFANSSAIWAAIVLFGLIAIYIFKRRSRNYTVSSILFFTKRNINAEGGQRRHRLQTPLIFFIEFLILLFLILAIANPMYLQKGRLIPVTIILDDSISMQALSDGFTARQKAIEYLKEYIFSEKLCRFTLVKTGALPEIIGKRDMTGDEAVSSLSEWKCEAGSSDVAGTVNYGLDISVEDALIIVVTDHCLDEKASKRIKWLSFGKPLDNLAITSATRTSAGNVDRCFFEFTNFSDKEQNIDAEIIDAVSGELFEKIEGKIEKGDSRRIVVKLKNKSGIIKAIIKNDGVLYDNEAVLVPITKQKLKASINIENKKLANAVKKALESSELAYESNDEPDVLFSDKKMDTLNPSILELRFHTASQPVILHSVIASDKDHLIGSDLPFIEGIWAVDANVKTTKGNLLLSAGDIPVMWEETNNNNSLVWFNYSYDYSNIQHTNLWPVLFYNILEYARQKLNGPAYFNYRSGNRVEIFTDRKSDVVFVKSKKDNSLEFECPAAFGKAVFTAEKSGLYEIKDNGNLYNIAVNLCSYDESDLRKATTRIDKIDIINSENMEHFSSIKWLFGIIIFILIILHQWLISKRRAGYVF